MKTANAFKLMTALILCIAVTLPMAGSKYVSKGIAAQSPQVITVVWSDPETIHGGNRKTTQDGANYKEIVVTEGVNEGWYAFVVWGASGGGGTNFGGAGGGEGGAVKGVAYFDAGTYILVAGAMGDHNTTNPTINAWPGGGRGYGGGNGGGGGGGGYSGIFKGSIAQGNAIAVAGGGGGGGGKANDSRKYNYGGLGAGALDGGLKTLGETPGGNSRHQSDGAAASSERGAGGGVTHASTGLHGGGTGGGESGSALKGGDASSTTWGGGGGGGYHGGGGGGKSGSSGTGSGDTCDGGGGGGSSYIASTHAGRALRTYFTGTQDLANVTTNHGFTANPLDPKIAVYLNNVPVVREVQHSNNYYWGGIVTLIYLGPETSTSSPMNNNDNDNIFNW